MSTLKNPDGLIIWKKIEFSLKGKLLFTAYGCTLPEAIKQAEHLKPISNFNLSITCSYRTGNDRLALQSKLLFPIRCYCGSMAGLKFRGYSCPICKSDACFSPTLEQGLTRQAAEYSNLDLTNKAQSMLRAHHINLIENL